MEKMLTAPEVAEWLTVKVITIRKWTSEGKIPYILLSRRAVRYSENAIKEWIQNKTVTERREKPNTDVTMRQRKRKKPKTFALSYDVNSIVSRAKKEVLNNNVG